MNEEWVVVIRHPKSGAGIVVYADKAHCEARAAQVDPALGMVVEVLGPSGRKSGLAPR